ncbi:sensor histidine kinase [Streptomyces sp. DSM 40484]|uniref:sensor histidine kinase n=1 Tax=Streptomyces kroppenstedtii TaxID=3051181 RepID=UPI0028D64AE0|nr:histidine kinase [Streptomyces sp. DSM 40484]
MNLAQTGAGARDTARRHPLLRDVLLAVGVVGMALVTDSPGQAPRGTTTDDVMGFALGMLAVAARRRFNRVALGACVGAAIVFLARDGQQQPMLTGAIALLLYTYAARTDRRKAWLIAGGIAVLLFLGGLLREASEGDNIGLLAWLGVGASIGDATRSRRAYIAEVEERARRAEQSRDEEARLRVVQERLRIARELHDVVAHHIAVIKVQASGAKHVLAHRPDRAGPALDHISRAADTALKEMASVVGLLRNSPDVDETTGLGTEPTRGLVRLPQLVDSFTTAGLRVECHQVGEARDLPVLVDMAAYRIAQEALTNAQKYGDGAARLTIHYTPETVTLDITNAIGAPTARPGSGYGILGMRERAAANAGTLRAGPCGPGRFAVHAKLPAPAREAAQ